MNVVVVIQGREAIPVRAIPLLTNWRFMSPDIVAHVLGGTGGSNVSLFGDMESSHIEAGKVRPMNKDWWAQFPVKELRALTEKIQMNESSHDAGYSDWRKQSLKELPAGVFVWKDQYQKLHDKNWTNRFQLLYGGLRYLSKEGDDNESTEEFEAQMLDASVCKDLLNDDDPLKAGLWASLEVLKRWREPDYAPFMRSDMRAIVMEGFESQVAADTHSAPVVAVSDDLVPLKQKRRTWRDVAFLYMVEVFKAGQYPTAKEFYRALEKKAGAGSPFDRGTGPNSDSLFVREISEKLTFKTIQNYVWPDLKASRQTG